MSSSATRPPFWVALPSNPHQELCTWTPLGDFRPRPPASAPQRQSLDLPLNKFDL